MGEEMDGFRFIQELSVTARSEVYLAEDVATQQKVVIKIPSVEMAESPQQLTRFFLEEWVAKRLNSPHIVKAYACSRPRSYLYSVMEYVEGVTLRQWMLDNPQGELNQVRKIVKQLAKGLQAFHRQEMLHQDIRPENIMIDAQGFVTLIDFGAARIPGLMEVNAFLLEEGVLGEMQYAAPEYFLGEMGTPKSDQFSLGVVVYEMLTGRLPYGTEAAKVRTPLQRKNLTYQPINDGHLAIPRWMDRAIQKAVHPLDEKRYDEVSEFIYDLHHPNPKLVAQDKPPLIERNPVRFWQLMALIEFAVIVLLLWKAN